MTETKYYVLTRKASKPGREPSTLYFRIHTHSKVGVWTAYIGEATLFTEEQAQSWSLFRDSDLVQMEPWEDPCANGHEPSHLKVQDFNLGADDALWVSIGMSCERCGQQTDFEVCRRNSQKVWDPATRRTVNAISFPTTKEQP